MINKKKAETRDHKKIGKNLDLFVFSDLVGAGLPLWTPKGALIRELLDNFVWSLRKKRGYQKVEIPHITKKELYETSGHWDKFQDELFHIKTREGHDFVLKPMNCPHHTQIFARKAWSYRELPQRYANTTMVYRDEQSGELNGLSRVRAITQDDSHIFCAKEQIKQEIAFVWEIISDFYSSFGFALQPRLSLHNPEKFENYLGARDRWGKAEETLRQVAREKKSQCLEQKGEAAFYGPKIDFMTRDALGREWQVGTIQLDFNIPERFGLKFINKKGKKELVAMLHVAVMGSIERFLAILLEHTNGNLPFWLSPEQIWILAISEKQNNYAQTIADKLKNYRVKIKDENETLSKKIKQGEMQKIPYLLIVGEKEEKNKKVAIRSREKGDLGIKALREIKKALFSPPLF